MFFKHLAKWQERVPRSLRSSKRARPQHAGPESPVCRTGTAPPRRARRQTPRAAPALPLPRGVRDPPPPGVHWAGPGRQRRRRDAGKATNPCATYSDSRRCRRNGRIPSPSSPYPSSPQRDRPRRGYMAVSFRTGKEKRNK